MKLTIQGHIEHPIFAGLFGVWTGLLLADQFPVETLGGYGFLIYLLLFIGFLTILLRISFSRRYFAQRALGYLCMGVPKRLDI